jgi:hypothetical protein
MEMDLLRAKAGFVCCYSKRDRNGEFSCAALTVKSCEGMKCKFKKSWGQLAKERKTEMEKAKFIRKAGW